MKRQCFGTDEVLRKRFTVNSFKTGFAAQGVSRIGKEANMKSKSSRTIVIKLGTKVYLY